MVAGQEEGQQVGEQYSDARAAPRTYDEFLQRFDETPECKQLKDRHFANPGELTPGKMKFENNIVEFVGLSPKVYAFNAGDEHNGIRVRGTNTMILKSNKHSQMEMVTVEQTKWALTPWGYSDIEYNPDRVFARIIRNCARRVNMETLKLLERVRNSRSAANRERRALVVIAGVC